MISNSLTNSISLPPSSLGPIGAPQTVTYVGEAESPSFKDLLLQSIGEVNGMQQDAQRAVEQLVTGGDVNMAEVMTTVQKADMSFRMMLQMRNKLVQAYEEIKDIRI